MEKREDNFILAVQFSFLQVGVGGWGYGRRGNDVTPRVGFNLEEEGAINVNLA